MHLELLIPTFQRPVLLRAALESVSRATRPRAMTVSVTVINNDTEPLVIEPALSAGPYPLRVLHERRRGKSAALNTGIAASTADYIGLIDDDEQIAADWLVVVERALETQAVRLHRRPGHADAVGRHSRRGFRPGIRRCSGAPTTAPIRCPTATASKAC